MPTIRFFLRSMTGRPANLLSLHDARGILHILPVEAEDDAFRHHVARGRGLRIEPCGKAAADDVAVRHHTDEAIVLADGDRADVVVLHQARELLDRRAGINPLHAPVHCALYFHGRLPFLCRPVCSS